MDNNKEFELELADIQMFHDSVMRIAMFFLSISTVYTSFYVAEFYHYGACEYTAHISISALLWAFVGCLLILWGRLRVKEQKKFIQRKYRKNEEN
jgi:hypothetical protein